VDRVSNRDHWRDTIAEAPTHRVRDSASARRDGVWFSALVVPEVGRARRRDSAAGVTVRTISLSCDADEVLPHTTGAWQPPDHLSLGPGQKRWRASSVTQVVVEARGPARSAAARWRPSYQSASPARRQRRGRRMPPWDARQKAPPGPHHPPPTTTAQRQAPCRKNSRAARGQDRPASTRKRTAARDVEAPRFSSVAELALGGSCRARIRASGLNR